MTGGLAVEAIATPVYRQDFYNENGKIRGSWFDIAETTLSLAPFTEFLIELVADEFALLLTRTSGAFGMRLI